MPSTLVPDTTDHKPTVLIVDDEAAPRAALTQILKQDFHILTADNARTALAVLNDHGVDLVTLDLKLPDRSGSDLLTDIKRERPTAVCNRPWTASAMARQASS